MASAAFSQILGGVVEAPAKARPPTDIEIRELIRTMAKENPLWRAPRIHGELLKLGITISERTVSRILRTLKRPPSQTWKTFLNNHIGEIVSIDFFTVPTVRLQVLYVFLVLEHKRRKVLHLGVTDQSNSGMGGTAGRRSIRRPRCSTLSDSGPVQDLWNRIPA